MGDYITSMDELRRLYSQPGERAVRKQLDRMDRHCRRFIALSPFVVVASGNPDALDASPRGGEPGFVRVLDDSRLLIPDAPGNNRLDSLANIIETGRVGLLFLIPGVDETLRVNGEARLSAHDDALAFCANAKRTPTLVIEVVAREVYLHCAKALMRAKLWSEEARVPRSVLPTLGEMLREQLDLSTPPESQDEMIARYRKDL